MMGMTAPTFLQRRPRVIEGFMKGQLSSLVQ